MALKLTELVQSKDRIVQELLTAILSPLVSFTEHGEIFIRESFLQLDAERKVLAIILSMQALHQLGMRESDLAGPTEISEASGIPSGTVKRTVRQLTEKQLLTSSKGKYAVPVFNLSKVAAVLTKNEVSHE